jgi:hypothetical protein
MESFVHPSEKLNCSRERTEGFSHKGRLHRRENGSNWNDEEGWHAKKVP